LLVRAAADAGAEVIHETAVTDVSWRHDRVVGVHAAARDGRGFDVHAPLVVGADGLHSIIARRVDAPVTRAGRHATAATYAYWTDVETNGYEWVFSPDACCGLIPTNDSQTCVFASASAARLGQGGAASIGDIVAHAAPELAQRLRVAIQPRGGHRGYMRQAVGPGWALVGDAGSFKDPISAHGLTDALRDAELLARGVIGGFGDEQQLSDGLAQYQDARDRLSIPMFDVVDRIASQQWDQIEIAELLLELSSTMSVEARELASLEPLPPRHLGDLGASRAPARV
jgi:flavin-dependent dehydrogenase